MRNWLSKIMVTFFFTLGLSAAALAQAGAGALSGVITDEKQSVIAGATVTARNTGTNTARVAQTDDAGRYQFENLPIGSYEITVEANGFTKYVRTGIILTLGQNATIPIEMKVASSEEVVTVTGDASILNTTNAEVSTRFDNKRLTELPLATNGNVYNVLLSVPGVSQLGSGQTGFANGTNFSSNGSRLRSNNFLIDGQDANDPSVSGAQQPLNNPDLIQEVRIATNQFGAEYGRNSGSVVNIVTKSGTNEFHGSAFHFYNGNALNALSNLDKSAGRTEAPFRVENRFGGSIGGPIKREKTFFFGTFQRATDRALTSGGTITGAPTAAGRQMLQSLVGSRPQVAALLRFLPAAQTATGATVPLTVNGMRFDIPTGSLTTAAPRTVNNNQFSARIDHQFNNVHKLAGTYLFNDEENEGSGQATPVGLTTSSPLRTQTFNMTLTSIFTPRFVNEFRAAYNRYNNSVEGTDPAALEIPSIEINQLGLIGFNAAPSRTAIGLGVNLPQSRVNNTYQILDNVSYTTGNHTLKFGVDVTHRQQRSFFVPTIRGRLAYSTLQDFVDDNATLGATINSPLPGGETFQYYFFTDFFAYVQDEWKVRPNLTLTLGLRYETPGNSVASLFNLNERIAAVNGPAFLLNPRPERDTNNFAPRFGFNYSPNTRKDGVLGAITGGDKLVLRGGYARAYDASFLNIALNIFSAFPFLASINAPTQGAFASLPNARLTGDPLRTLNSTIVSRDFRSPVTDQFSLEVQRELSSNLVLRVGYVGTKGSALFQTIDANPALPRTNRSQPLVRLDPTRGVIRERANSAASIYHSLQVSVDKRLSKNFSAGFHYTWSSFIDDASEIFNPSSAEVAVPQDSFNRRADRARSSFDRPHRFTGNAVYELPFFRDQKGLIGHLLGGFQVNGFFTLQSGAPFTVLNGADPTGALQGIDGLVGNAIRPNLNTGLNVSSMTIEEIRRAGGSRLFAGLAGGQRTGAAGRNILRADGIGNLDLSVFKNTRIREGQNLQFRMEMFNATNTRNFGIPDGRFNSQNFLNEGATDGGNRRIVVALRYTF
jgi:outer membrane receptor protein involved in Fe transport